MQVVLCQQFQVKLFNLLLKRNLDKPLEDDQHSETNCSAVFNYLLFPALGPHHNISIDWSSINSVLYEKNASLFDHSKCSSSGDNGQRVYTKSGLVCRCVLENSLVCTPHNGFMYSTLGTLDGVRGNTYFAPRDGEHITYKEYYQMRFVFYYVAIKLTSSLDGKKLFWINEYSCRHGISLKDEKESFLKGKQIFTVHNYLQRCRTPNKKGLSTPNFMY